MLNKKILTAVILLAMTSLFSIQAFAQSAVEITVRCYSWMCDGELGLIRSQVEAWDAANPGANVTIQVVDDWEYLLVQDAIAGTAPDLAYYRDPFPLLEAGLVRNISDWYDLEALQADFIPEYWEQYMTYEGELYAIFQDTETRGVYYRADWVEELGLEAPVSGWTFADMREYVAALTTSDRAGVCIGREVAGLVSMSLNAGYEQNIMDYNHPAVEAMYQFFADIIADGSAVPEQTGLSRDDCQRLFEAGRAGMIFLHNNGISSTFATDSLAPEQVGFVSQPVLNEGDQYRGIGGGFMWMVMEKEYSDEKLELVKDLFMTMTSAENQVEYAMAWGFMLPRISHREALLETIQSDPAQAERAIFKFWEDWINVSAHTEAFAVRDDVNQFTWGLGLANAIEVIQAGLPVEDAITFAQDYFDTNKR